MSHLDTTIQNEVYDVSVLLYYAASHNVLISHT